MTHRASLVLFPTLLVLQGAPTITSEAIADGLTLRVTATCPRHGEPCPFLAEIHASRMMRNRIDKVAYMYAPDHRTPSSITDASTAWRFEGAQYGGELVYADVTLKGGSAGAPKKVALQTTIPFTADVRPELPHGLRFEDKYWMQFLEGTPSGVYFFRIRLRGDRQAASRIQSVTYRLPETAGFHPREPRPHRATEWTLEGGGPRSRDAYITAIIRWTNGRTSTHAIRFRPHEND